MAPRLRRADRWPVGRAGHAAVGPAEARPALVRRASVFWADGTLRRPCLPCSTTRSVGRDRAEAAKQVAREPVRVAPLAVENAGSRVPSIALRVDGRLVADCGH